MSVAETALTGDRRKLLEALRDKLAEAIDQNPEPKDLASLVLRLERVTAQLEDLGPVSFGGSFEERLNARRKAKQAAAG